MPDVEAQIEKMLLDPSLSKEQADLIRKYDSECRAIGMASGYRKNIILALRDFAIFIKKPFGSATREDILGFVSKLRADEPSDATVELRVGVLKRFYTWLNNDEYPRLRQTYRDKEEEE